MALAKTVKFSEWLIKVDPEIDGTFVAPCGLTTRGIAFAAATKDTIVPDCDDEDAVAWLERDTVSLSASISGTGVLDRDAYATWRTLLGISVPYRAETAGSGATGGGYWQGYFILTKLDLKGDRGDKVTVDVTMDSDGAVAWTDAA